MLENKIEFLPLSMEEIVEAKKLQKNNLMIMVPVALLFQLFALIPYFTEAPFFMTIIFSAFGMIPLVFFTYMYILYQKDLSKGEKKVITGILNDKLTSISQSSSGTGTSRTTSTSRTHYYLIAGEKIAVTDDWYNKFNTGQYLQINLLPKSKTILSIIPLGEIDKQKSFSFTSSIQEKVNSIVSGSYTSFSGESREELLTDDDKLIIKKQGRKAFNPTLGFTIFFSLFISVFVVVFGILFIMFVLFPLKIFIPLNYFLLAYFGTVLLIDYNILKSHNRKYQKDIEGGLKNVFKTRIIDKNHQTFNGRPSYYLKVEGQLAKMPVIKYDYDQFQSGEQIIIEQSPNAKVLLNMYLDEQLSMSNG